MTKRLQSFKPVFEADAEVLVLGSMPGKASLDAGQYYAHPRNLFWALILGLELAEVPRSYEQRLLRLKQRKVALWDTLKHCEREGSLDSAIDAQTEEANDFPWLFAQLPQLRCIAFNGKKSQMSFERHVLKAGVDCRAYDLIALPSTSPANAGQKFAFKRERWARLFQ